MGIQTSDHPRVATHGYRWDQRGAAGHMGGDRSVHRSGKPGDDPDRHLDEGARDPSVAGRCVFGDGITQPLGRGSGSPVGPDYPTSGRDLGSGPADRLSDRCGNFCPLTLGGRSGWAARWRRVPRYRGRSGSPADPRLVDSRVRFDAFTAVRNRRLGQNRGTGGDRHGDHDR